MLQWGIQGYLQDLDNYEKNLIYLTKVHLGWEHCMFALQLPNITQEHG